MSIEIQTIGVGIVNRYLIHDESWMLIDPGIPYTTPMITRALKRLAVEPDWVKLILLTHGHVDHAGAAGAVQELTGAKVAIHQRDRLLLERGQVAMPPLWMPGGRVLYAVLNPIARLLRFRAARADVVITDEGLSLVTFGIHGRVIYTPGHTAGSVSVLLDSGEAFVGDLIAGPSWPHQQPRLPPAGEDQDEMWASLRNLLGQGARTIYPGHGKPFSAQLLGSAL
jgi:hydroxyacylglutathione hydrolase